MSHTKITLPVIVQDHYAIPFEFRVFSETNNPEHPDETRFWQFPIKGERRGPFDPWQLRNDFLTWPNEDWQGFCRMFGYFWKPLISKNLFTEWQRLLRKALILPAREWKTLTKEFVMAGEYKPGLVEALLEPLKIRFDWDEEFPVARIRENSVLKKIIATIQVDALQGAQFRVCARHDCKNPPFQVEARQKIFCCSDCAHLVAVRNSRERAAKAKNKVAKNAPNKMRL
ncbi:MAG: hypothetical protein WB424_00950 [Terracidiphilus sp.]